VNKVGENRLVAAQQGKQCQVTFAYDYMGRRVSKVTEDGSGTTECDYVYDGWALIRERIASGETAQTNSYVYGLDLSGSLQGAGTIAGILATVREGDSAPVVGFYAYDANGNVTDLVGTNGTGLAHYEYDPFGNPLVATGDLATANPFRFSTKYTDDETGLVYYGYRFYNPELGRWLSRDPIGETAFFAQYTKGKDRDSIKALAVEGLAPPYLFVYNSPISRYDDKGLVAPVVIAVGLAAACLYPHFEAGMSRYPDDEAMRHCWTSCTAARTCGPAISGVAGLGFEVVTEALSELFSDSTADWRNAMYDLFNNAVGLNCAGIESAVPGLGNITRWFRESCECCCQRSL
jgi:RHS repeat-associated protein